jgi:hypothetical protein
MSSLSTFTPSFRYFLPSESKCSSQASDVKHTRSDLKCHSDGDCGFLGYDIVPFVSWLAVFRTVTVPLCVEY